VLSAPVYSKDASAYIGFLDTRDLVSFVVFQAEEKGKAKSSTDTLQVPDLDLPSLLDTAARMPAYTAQNLTTGYLAARNKFIPVSPDDTVLKVVDILRRASVHRVPVVAADGSLVDIISQSTIISFVYAHRAELAKSFTKTVDEVKLGSRPVIPVSSSQTAFDTFKVMDKYNRSGIAVVDEEGRFVGNTSGSDLKVSFFSLFVCLLVIHIFFFFF
jgi:CBS domain-containing protein